MSMSNALSKISRPYNFSPGPAMLPTEVLEVMRDELLDWHGTGASVMELNHRGKYFPKIMHESEQDLRDLLNIPDNYHVLFLHGGGRLQFSMIPMNFSAEGQVPDYFNTGLWSKIAISEAMNFCNVNQVVNTENESYKLIPESTDWNLNSAAPYVHIVDNETVDGVEFSSTPDVGDVPLISDMSSNILSRPIDVEKYAMVYACAQKNVGPAGVTIVIIRDDLITEQKPKMSSMLCYKNHVKEHSYYNTPPTLAWYVTGLVLKWIKKQGGLDKMAEINQRKAQKLYNFIDASDIFYNNVNKKDRSRMNVVFNLHDESHIKRFLEESEKAGLTNLKGHHLKGGLRASIYNAMPEAGVDTLINFMHRWGQDIN